MKEKLILDFTEMPLNSPEKYVISAEQICLLCGLNRRTGRRVGKVVFRILNCYSPDSLLEHSVQLIPTRAGWVLGFCYLTDPIELNTPEIDSANLRTVESLRRCGEKLDRFEIAGKPSEGQTIRFSLNLAEDFGVPLSQELKHWGRIIAKGDWEEAFELVAKRYLNGRARQRQFRDVISIGQGSQVDDKQQLNTILSLIASKTDNPVFLVDSLGKIEWLNQAACQTCGLDSEQSLDRNITEILIDSTAATETTAHKEFEASLKEASSFRFEYFRESDPECSLWTTFQFTPVRDDDSIVRWIAIGSDVTQRRKAEKAMQAAKEVAETASKAKSEFLAMMSHEIRTPMNAILGMTELALSTRLTSKQRDFLTISQNSAQSLLQILNDILDLSKVEASRLQIEHVDFNLADLVRDTLDTMRFLAGTKGVKLRCDFPMEIPQDLVGDPVRVRQIIVNLVGNAIKFTSEGEVIFASDLTDETDQNVTIHCSVRDTGTGIAEEKTSRIFEAFYQTDVSITRDFGGTGLGLAITSELVRLMGGRIWVESKLGVGSTFHFVLTLPKSTRQRVGVTSKILEHLDEKSILIADANEADRQFLVDMLSNLGVVVRTVASGNEAIEILSDKKDAGFDIVIIDSKMPSMDGFEIASKAKKIRKRKTTPLMILPSDDRTNSVEKCRSLGIEDFLVRPISRETLVAAIQNALGRASEKKSKIKNGSNSLWKQAASPLDVLVVDDHPSNRVLACEILHRRGHRFFEASSGVQAIGLIRQRKFDVVLMDVQMPEQDGLETTRQIRELAGANSLVPVIAVTAYVTPDDRQRCLDARMDDYLPKPLSTSDLIEKVERWGLTTNLQEKQTLASQQLAEHLVIQDVPGWAAQVARTVAVSVSEIDETVTMGSDAITPLETQKPAYPDSVSRAANHSGTAEQTEENQFAPALARLGGDEELLRMQMGFFLEETPQLKLNIQTALANEDFQALHLNAHRLKGLVRSYDDSIAEELATTLENLAREGDLEEADSTSWFLSVCVDNLRKQIEIFLDQMTEAH